MPTTLINSSSWNYQDSGSGPTIVLLHGFPLSNQIWRDVVPELARRHRVIAPDFPGFGKSTLGQPFTIASLADDLHTLLRQIGASPCVLGGLSMGGYVAAAYYRAFAASLRGLMLIDTKVEADTDAQKQGRTQMIELVHSHGAKAVSDQMFPKMLGTGVAASRPQLAHGLREIMESCPPATIEAACLAMRDRPDNTDLLPGISIPTLVIVGQSDVITPPAAAEKMRAAIPKAHLATIPQAGHLSPMEHPVLVAQAIGRFVEGIK